MCRALDAYGFATLAFQINRHASITSSYYGTDDEPQQFKTGTPAELQSTIARVWSLYPTLEEINHDINGYMKVLDAIIEAKGCMVEDKDIHQGARRAAATTGRNDGSGSQQVTNPARKRQRQATLKEANGPVHADAQKGWDDLKAVAGDEGGAS